MTEEQGVTKPRGLTSLQYVVVILPAVLFLSLSIWGPSTASQLLGKMGLHVLVLIGSIPSTLWFWKQRKLGWAIFFGVLSLYWLYEFFRELILLFSLLQN